MIRALSVLILCSIAAAAQTSSRVQVRLDTDEPEAVLAILAKRQAGTAITGADWKKVFETEGYRRLKKRELSMKNKFEDADFQKFVMSPELLARAAALKQTLDKWKQTDMSRPGKLALAYLPQNATIKATIYPSIKPRDNSFVFEVDRHTARLASYYCTFDSCFCIPLLVFPIPAMSAITLQFPAIGALCAPPHPPILVD